MSISNQVGDCHSWFKILALVWSEGNLCYPRTKMRNIEGKRDYIRPPLVIPDDHNAIDLFKHEPLPVTTSRNVNRTIKASPNQGDIVVLNWC